MALNLNILEYIPKKDGEASGKPKGGDPNKIDYDISKYIPKESRAKSEPSPIKYDYTNPTIAPGQGNVTLSDDGFSQQGVLDTNADFGTQVTTDVPADLKQPPPVKNNIVQDLEDAVPKIEKPSLTGNLLVDIPQQELQKINYVGQSLGAIFSIGDALVKNIPGHEKEGRDFSQVVNAPFVGLHLGYEELKKGTQNLLDYMGVPKNVQNLGMDDKQVEPLIKSLDQFNEMAIQYGVPGTIHPLLKSIKGKVEILPDEMKTPENISAVVDNEVNSFKEKRDKLYEEIKLTNAEKGKNIFPELQGNEIPFAEAQKYRKPYKVFDYDFSESGKTTPADIEGFKKLQDIENKVQSDIGAQIPVDMDVFKDANIDPEFNGKENKSYKRFQDLKESAQKYNEGGFFDIPKNWKDRVNTPPEIIDAYKNATGIQDKLNSTLNDVVKENDLVQFHGSQKSIGSIVDKIKRKQPESPGYNVNSLKDLTRGAIIMNDFSEVPKVVESLQEKLGNVKDAEVSINEPLNQFGYRGVHLNSEINGIKSEIQLHTKDSWEVKKETDAIYRKWRNVTDETLNSKPELHAEYIKDIAHSSNLWNDYWAKVPEDVKAKASDSVNGLESVNVPKVKESSLTHLPSENTSAPLAEDNLATLPDLSKPYVENSDVIDPNISNNEKSINAIDEKTAKAQRIAELKAKIKENNAKFGLQSSVIGGLNPENVPHYLELGKLHLESGLTSFVDWSKQMIEDIGDHIKPHLKDLWNKVSKVPDSKPEVQLDNIFATDQKYVKGLQDFKDAPLGERMTMAKNKYLSDVKEIPSNLWNATKRNVVKALDTGKVIMQQYLHPPVESDLNVSTRNWTGGRNIISKSVDDIQHKIKSVIPDGLTDRAINAYIEADGSTEQLTAWRNEAKKEINKKKYDRALKLTQREKDLADFIRGIYKDKAKDGIDSGIITQVVENYVNHKWKKENTATHSMMNDFNYGSGLKTNLENARKRIFHSNFEGEQLGYESVSDKISDNVAMYMQAFDHVANDRYFVKKLMEGKASDGRPIVGTSGVGVPMKNSEGVTQATLIKPNAKPTEIGDYRDINVPALKNWKLVYGGDKPMLLEADLVVHPEYANKLKNALKWGTKEGKIDLPVYNQVRFMQQQAKGMIFFINPFHAVQEGYHSLTHEINPLKMIDFDPSNPIHKRAVNSGLMLTDYDAMEMISEGLSVTKAVEKFPILGQIGSEIKDFTFKKQIPAYKLRVWEAMRSKNEKSYAKSVYDFGKRKGQSKYSQWQLDAMTSDQVNAAFGHLNYRAMFRNPIVQEVFRFLTIAPDFLEARTKFTAQALKPSGVNQLRALMVSAGGLYILSRTVNQLVNGDMYLNDPSMAFSVKLGDRVYDLRSVPGDLIEAVTDPRRFISNRLSPIGKFGEELLTGKDWQGRPMTFSEATWDMLMTYVPAMVRGRQDMNFGQSLLSNFGLRNKQYKTAIEKNINEEYWKYFPPGTLTDKQKNKSELFNQIRDLKMKGDLKGAQELFTKGVDEKLISEKKDYDDFLKDLDEGLYMNRFKLLPPEAQEKLWTKMNLIEREKYQPLLNKDAKKFTGTENTKDKYNDLQDELHRLQAEWSSVIDADGNVKPENKQKADEIANRYRQVNDEIANFKNTEDYQKQKQENKEHKKENKNLKETIQNYK